jgi:hypothetical protein
MPAGPADQQRILITQATAGMVLARPVMSKEGVALCGPGTVLTEPLIQRLVVRGLKRIHVEGHPVATRSQLPVEQRIRELRHRFSRVADVPLMALLERAIEQEMLRRE